MSAINRSGQGDITLAQQSRQKPQPRLRAGNRDDACGAGDAERMCGDRFELNELARIGQSSQSLG